MNDFLDLLERSEPNISVLSNASIHNDISILGPLNEFVLCSLEELEQKTPKRRDNANHFPLEFDSPGTFFAQKSKPFGCLDGIASPLSKCEFGMSANANPSNILFQGSPIGFTQTRMWSLQGNLVLKRQLVLLVEYQNARVNANFQVLSCFDAISVKPSSGNLNVGNGKIKFHVYAKSVERMATELIVKVGNEQIYATLIQVEPAMSGNENAPINAQQVRKGERVSFKDALSLSSSLSSTAASLKKTVTVPSLSSVIQSVACQYDLKKKRKSSNQTTPKKSTARTIVSAEKLKKNEKLKSNTFNLATPITLTSELLISLPKTRSVSLELNFDRNQIITKKSVRILNTCADSYDYALFMDRPSRSFRLSRAHGKLCGNGSVVFIVFCNGKYAETNSMRIFCGGRCVDICLFCKIAIHC